MAHIEGGGCVPCDDLPDERRYLAPDRFPWGSLGEWTGPAKGACGTHIAIQVHNADVAMKTCLLAERYYAELMPLLGFAEPEYPGLYPIGIFADSKEFDKQTGTEGSYGISIGNQILTFESGNLENILYHEMVHVLLHEHLELGFDLNSAWFGEGLAETLAWISTGGDSPKLL